MIGKIFVTRSGYDPQMGKHVKDPYLGPNPSLGACRPDIRKVLQLGDFIFVVSGKLKNVEQVVMGGFQIAEKISAMEAYDRFPDRRLRRLPDGQITGNIITSADGSQHPLDNHDKFNYRTKNYIVGTNPIILQTTQEMDEGRQQTLDMLRSVFDKRGNSVREVIGRCSNLNEKQILKLYDMLVQVKKGAQLARSPGIHPDHRRNPAAASGLEQIYGGTQL